MLFDEFSDGGSPVYIIAVTNNAGNFDETNRDAYMSMRSRGIEAMLGQWTKRERTFQDIVMAMSGINRRQALKYKKQYNQLTMVGICGDGTTGYF